MSPKTFAISAGAAALMILGSCETGRARGHLWTPTGTVTRAEAIEIADAYALHRWTPAAANAFHGNDASGIRVDTPDAGYKPGTDFPGWWRPGMVNTGLPYKWGGFDTPEQFDAALRAGRAAGDVCTDQKRTMDNAAISSRAAGIDCSGLISRCWRLQKPFSTYEIAKLCDPLPDFSALRPGDVLNKEHEHVMLFAGCQPGPDANMIVYDVGCPEIWRCAKHLTPVAWLRAHGYKAWRYRGIRD
jgi:hypothetical protein